MTQTLKLKSLLSCFKLAADIDVTLENVSQEEAEQYVEQAHQFCPYSKATRGNIDVNLKANAQ